MFSKYKIKTFKLTDLVGKNIDIRSSKEGHVELVVAADTKTGKIFVIKEIRHDVPVEVAEAR
jgi:uncharacterized protein YwbE